MKEASKYLVIAVLLSLFGTVAYADDLFSGPVGIGTTAPANALHIAQDNANRGNLGGQLYITTLSDERLGLSVGFTVETGMDPDADGYAWLQSGHYKPGVAPYLPLELNADGGNVSIGRPTNNRPPSKFSLYGGDLEIFPSQYGPTGIVLHSPNGSCARIEMDNSFALTVTPINCPYL